MNLIVADTRQIAQLELDEYLWQQSQEIAPELELDTVREADCRLTYRVWFGIKLLGIFYHNSDDLWIAQLWGSSNTTCCSSSNEAQSIIVAMSKLPVS